MLNLVLTLMQKGYHVPHFPKKATAFSFEQIHHSLQAHLIFN